jgi:two-component system sensor histidine kinase UhpB
VADHPNLLARIWQKLSCLSIYKKIAIGNSAIIIAGAIGGTLITRHLATLAADLGLILLYAAAGISVSILLNGWIIRTALQPLSDLGKVAARAQAGLGFLQDGPTPEADGLIESDPDICLLAGTLNALVTSLEKHNQQLRALSKRAISAQEEERRRIALSLHDDTGQALSMLIINLERLENRIPEDRTELQMKLAAARQLASRALDDLRHIIRDLRPAILDDLGLVPAIRWYARSNLEEAGIRVEVQASDDLGSLSPELNSTLFRVAQEAINNIVRHSGAKSVQITLCRDEAEIQLKVEDDGHGFDVLRVSESALRSQQWGLLGMQERAELVGGQVSVESQPGKGTRLDVRAPLMMAGEAVDG